MLDKRLRAAIRSVAPSESLAGVGPHREFRRGLASWSVAAAASIAVLVGSALFWHSLGEGHHPSSGQFTAMEMGKPPADEIDSAAALVEDTAVDFEQWMASAVGDNQWAGLDRDAETAMAAVTGPLPFDLSLAIVATDPTE